MRFTSWRSCCFPPRPMSARRSRACKAEGAIFLSYKSLYYELFEAVGGSRHFEKIVERFGPFPDDLSEPTGQ